MAENLGDAVLQLSTRDNKLRGGLRRAQALTKRAGAKMAKFLTLPLSALGAVAGRQAAVFGDEMNKLVSLVGLPRDAVENELIPAILKLGPAIGKVPIELAKGLFPIASAGFDAAQSFKILTAASIASAAGMGEVAVAAKGTTKILANYGDELSSAAEATGILVAVTKAADAPPEAMAAALAKVLPTAKALSLDLRNVGAELAFLTRPMGTVETASSALAGVFRKLQKPPLEMIPIIDAAGLSLERLQKIAGEQGTQAAVKALADTFGVASIEFARFFEDAEALNAALLLVGDTTGEVTGLMKDLATSGVGSLITALEEAAKSPMFKFRQGMASIQASMIVLGNAVLPVVTPLISKLTDIIIRATRAFAALSPKVQNMILTVAGIVALAGPVLLIGSLFIKFGLLIAGVVKNVVVAITFMARGIVAAFLRIGAFLLSVPGLIIVGLTTIVVLFFGFRDTIKAIWDELWTALKENTTIALDNLKSALVRGLIGAVNAFLTVSNSVKSLLGKELDQLLPVPKTLEPKDFLGFSEFDAGKIAAAFKKDIGAIKAKVAGAITDMINAIKNIIPKGLMDLFFPEGLEQTEIDLLALVDTMGKLPGQIGKITGAADIVKDSFEEMADSISSSIASATTDAIVNLRSLASFARSISDIILGAFVQQAIGIPFGNLFGNLFSGGAAAHGGPVAQGRSFLVGEQGPEEFVPRRSGTIIPNDMLGGGGRGGDIIINAQMGTPAQLLATIRNVAAEVATDTSVQTIKRAFS